MEKEHFVSGYCRTIDQSRIVTAVMENGQLAEVDCCFDNCIHAPNCTIAEEIRQLTQEN